MTNEELAELIQKTDSKSAKAELLEHRQRHNERETDFINTLEALIDTIPKDSPKRVEYMAYLEQYKKGWWHFFSLPIDKLKIMWYSVTRNKIKTTNPHKYVDW